MTSSFKPQAGPARKDPAQIGRHGAPLRAGQHGVVLLYALIAIVILMISGLALVRGVGTALAVGGDFAMRRDLINQGELGVAQAKSLFLASGDLGTAAARNSPPIPSADNYSATTLANEPSGIPIALLDDPTFSASFSGADIHAGNNITIRYVIDRQCSTTGPAMSNTCMLYQPLCKAGGVGCSGPPDGEKGTGTPPLAVYRITVRVTGPKNTIAFLQTTLGS
jgi:hypothetical protein